MGPSGAGKSSLLNVLAGRSAAAEGISVSGHVTVGGTPINPVSFRKNIAYVMQDDALMATQTPEEVLRFSATLRLPTETPAATIEELVKTTIVNLGLEGCKDVMVGGPMIKGISGGQRKRTSIGMEIITDPELLFRKCTFMHVLAVAVFVGLCSVLMCACVFCTL
jgi:ABC-type multidrug transport system ATPase subunit